MLDQAVSSGPPGYRLLQIPEANTTAFRGGWFRIGDLGHLDAEGLLFITGRASDIHISGGSNVYPRETEEELLTHPDILEVSVSACPTRSGAR